MRIKLILTLSALVLGKTFTGFSQTKTSIPYSAEYLSVCQQGGIWAFGEGPSGKGLYKYFNDWEFISFDIAEKVIATSSTYGEILVVTGKGEIKEWNNNNKRWLSYPGITEVKDAFISKANGNRKYALGKVKQADGTEKFGFYYVDNISSSASSWMPIYSDAVLAECTKAANDVADNCYFVTSAGRFMVKNKNSKEYTYLDTDGKFAVDVLVGEDNKVYMMERGGGIYVLVNSTMKWESSSFSASSFGVDDKGNVYGVVNEKIEGLVGGQNKTVSVENPNTLDAYGNTALTAAIVQGNDVLVKAAIVKGCDVDFANSAGDTPIILAAKQKNTTVINLLVANGADVNSVDKDGNSALYHSVTANDKACAQALLIAKADPNKNEVVAKAVEAKNSEMIILLSTYNADLTPGLSRAVELDDAAMFTTLISYGAKLTSNKPYEIAVDKGNTAIANTCLENGANKDEAVKYAVQKNNKEIIELCLSKGAPASPVIDYVLLNNDVEMANKLMTNYAVKPETLLARAVPGTKVANTGTSQNTQPTNVIIAEAALMAGANGSPYIKHAVVTNNEPLVNAIMVTGGDKDLLLKESVAANNIPFAELAMANGATVEDSSYLLSAIQNDRNEMVVLLLDNGAPTTDPQLIKAAVEKSNEGVCERLIAGGASVADNTLLPTAITNNKLGIVTLLIDNGADVNSGMKAAINANNSTVTSLLLTNGADASDPEFIKVACAKGNSQIVTALIDNGANPDNGMETAVTLGQTEVFKTLVDRGADPVKENLVVSAVNGNQVAIFKILLEKGAPVSYVNNSNQSLLHMACAKQSYAIVEQLIQKGLDINQKDNSGSTPLILAIENGRNNVDLAALLVSNGADVNAKNNQGKSVYKLASGKKLKDYLKSKGASKK